MQIRFYFVFERDSIEKLEKDSAPSFRVPNENENCAIFACQAVEVFFFFTKCHVLEYSLNGNRIAHELN